MKLNIPSPFTRLRLWSEYLVFLDEDEDEDECQTKTHNCDVNAQCKNTIGSFNCTCLQGYLGDGMQCSGENNSVTILHELVGAVRV